MGDDIEINVTETTNIIEITPQPNDQIVDIAVTDNAPNVEINVTPSVVEINVTRGSSTAIWGSIDGNLTDQSDLVTALGLKADLVGGKVPSSQLPSYVDDVIEVANYAALPTIGEVGKIYVTLDNNKIYRWSGSVYIEIAANNAIWGAITGTLSNQTDLQNALNTKEPTITAGTTSQYWRGDKSWQTLDKNAVGLGNVDNTSDLNKPISTATQTALDLKFNNPTGDTTQYIAGDGSLITFPVSGQAGTIVREVRNTTGATLTKGTIVYISGATGNKATISKAIATGDSTSAQTFGLLQANISNNANGYVVVLGDLIGLDTSGITEGTQLYLSSTVAGAYTTTKQVAPAHLVYIGVVTRSHPTLGQIEVKIQNGYELDEIHDVSITSKANNQFLVYESASNLWKNKSLSTILGGTSSQFLKGDGSLDSTAYALDSAVVKLAGAQQTISGVKVFTANVVFSGPSVLFDSSTGILLKQVGLSNYNQIQAIDGGFQFFENVGTSFYFNIQQSSIAFGLNTRRVTFNNSNLTSNRVYDLPNAGGTIALTYQLHDAVTIGTANGLSLSGQALSLGLASASTNGALSSTDWNTFNGKQNALTNPITGTGTTNYLPKFTGSTALGNSQIYDNGTNIGIGTTSPSEKLDISGNLRLSDTAPYLTLKPSGWSGSAYIQAGINLAQSAAGDYFSFQNLAGKGFSFQRGTTTDMLINSSGNVGIGTTSPTAKLDVVGGGIRFGNGTIIGELGYSSRAEIGTISNHNLGFTTNSITQMLITSGGNVGIGTTSPVRKFDVISSAEQLRLAFDTSGSTYTDFRSDSAGGLLINTSASYIINYIAGSAKTRINANGDFIVYTLGTGLVYSNGGILTSTNPSDSRLKDDIADLQYGLNEILQLRPVSYNWKNDNINQGKQFGFIAQEVQEVMPELVKEFETEDGERLGLDKEGIYAALVNAIKELEERIKILEK